MDSTSKSSSAEDPNVTPPTRRRRHYWASTAARRVQLAVASSVRQLSSAKAAQLFKDESQQQQSSSRHPNNGGESAATKDEQAAATQMPALILACISTTNIDEALKSLYDETAIAELLSESSSSGGASYVPEKAIDWLLDGGDCLMVRSAAVADSAQECAYLFQELHADPLETISGQLRAWEECVAREERERQELDAWNAFPDADVVEELLNEAMIEDDEDDEDDFGDFQSAPVIDDEEEDGEEKKCEKASGPYQTPLKEGTAAQSNSCRSSKERQIPERPLTAGSQSDNYEAPARGVTADASLIISEIDDEDDYRAVSLELSEINEEADCSVLTANEDNSTPVHDRYARERTDKVEQAHYLAVADNAPAIAIARAYKEGAAQTCRNKERRTPDDVSNERPESDATEGSQNDNIDVPERYVGDVSLISEIDDEENFHATSVELSEINERADRSTLTAKEDMTTPIHDLHAHKRNGMMKQALSDAADTPTITIARTYSDVDDTPALVLHADKFLRRVQEGDWVSPPESASSVDTPDLVQWTDEVLSSAALFALGPSLDCNVTGSVATSNETHKDTALVVGEPATTPHGRQLSSSPSRPTTSGHCRRSSAPALLSSPIKQHHQQEAREEELIPLSLQMPVDDLSTLEARFTRRLQQHYRQSSQQHGERVQAAFSDSLRRSAASKELDLPSYYYTSPDLDDTVSVLESLPWHYVLPPTGRGPHGPSRSGEPDKSDFDPAEYLALWDENTTSRLCRLDSALEQIQSDVLENIQPHQPTLQRANDLIHEWEQNLRLAFMYWERSKKSIEAATGSETDAFGLAGPSVLLSTWQQRDEYHFLNGTLAELDDVWTRERDLLSRIDRFDVKHSNALDEYFGVMKLAKALEKVVTSGRLAKLRCLDELRERLTSIGKRFWNRLLEIARSVVVRCCRQNSQFDWVEYERLIRAVLDLHSQASVDKSLEQDLASSWTENMLAAFSYEADKAFAAALLEPNAVEESKFDHELKQLSVEIDLGWGDRAKLRSIAHTLVTIRFDFESEINYLPRVIQRLCKLLTEILHAHFLFVQWHRVPFDDRCRDASALHDVPLSKHDVEHADLSAILTLMNGSATIVWQHCVSVFAKCIDEYLHFATWRSLFTRSENGTDDTLWRDELESLHDVLVLTNRFCSLKKSFLSDEVGDNQELALLQEGRHNLLSEKLSNVFRRHLRLVHVEAMNTIGRRLANETWILGSFTLPPDAKRTELPEATIGDLFMRALAEASRRSPFSKAIDATRNSALHGNTVRCQFSRFKEDGNPFDYIRPPNVNVTEETPQQMEDLPQSQSSVHRALNILIHEQDGALRLAPDAVTRELVVWFARLLLVMEKLPLIAEDASAVFANLCDLYFTTVFRLCAGNGKSERILLGEEAPSPLLIAREDPPATPVSDDSNAGTTMFSAFLKTQKRTSKIKMPTRPRTILPSFLEAEICSPLLRDSSKVERLQQFIQRAQKSLRDVVNLDMVDSWMVDPHADTREEQACEVARVLAKREGAIWGCLSVAALVEAVVKVARRNFASSFVQASVVDEELASLKAYCQAVLDVIPTLTLVARQISCTKAVSGSEIVKEIIKVGQGWEECKLHEHSNDYIEDVCDRCALIWGYLAASAKVPFPVMKETWENIVSSSYRSLLDGFARVPFCSTEGRALMTLDLAAFAAGISPPSVSERLESIVLANKPPSVHPECSLRYVETYIKVFYYPKEDILNWIAENCCNYKLNHSLALAVAAAVSSTERSPENALTALLEHVKMLYRQHSDAAVISGVN